MAQIKIYGLRDSLETMRAQLSDVVHRCVVEALRIPIEKKFHRFFPLASENFVFPSERSARYTIIEIHLMQGRSDEAKKKLIHLLFARCEFELEIAPMDLEIEIVESPRANWGFRGQTGDEIALNYRVEI